MTIYERVDEKKTAIDRVRPFEGEHLRLLREYYRIGLTWSSNAIEGNSLTELETKILLEDGLTAGGKPLRDIYEAVGHSRAYDYMFGLAGGRTITADIIKNMHRLFYSSIDEKNAGVWRGINIIVTGSDHVFPPPETIDALIGELESWIIKTRDKTHPVRFAALLHLKFVTVHPFIDGNGRVARLLMNLSLIQDGYLLAVIPPILRHEYMGLIRSYQQRGTDSPFCDFIAGRVLESEKEIIRLLRVPE